jgi:hypothetical protein
MLTALYAITAINVLVASGFAIAGLIRPNFVAPGQQTEASRIFALYAFARTIPLALVTFAAMLWGPLVAVLWLGALAGLVQLVDGYVGLQQKDPGKTWGPVAIGVLQFAAIAWVVFAS